jgi:mono/diheme cytochrome c family protein
MRLLAALALGVVAVWAGVARADPPLPLKPGPGGDITATACNSCHTSNYIVMNSTFLTPDGWKAEVTKMRSAFGAPLDDATAAAISAYLGANYGVKP